MEWASRHEAAIKLARHVCRLESTGQIMIALIAAIASIAAVWIYGAPNEAWSEILVRAGATLAIILIFPVVYLFNLLNLGPLAKRKAQMLITIGVVGLVISAGLILAGLILQRPDPKAAEASLAALRGELATVQKQLKSLQEAEKSTEVPKVGIAVRRTYTERDIRELLDKLEDASSLIEKRIFPTTNAITTTAANWYSLIPNMGVKGSAAHLKEMRASLQTEVWEPINNLVYDPSNRHQDEMRLAFVLDDEAAKGELSRALQVAIDALEKLPDNPSESTRDLVKPQFKEAYEQGEIVYNWLMKARNRIEAMKKNLREKGELGLEN